MPDVYVENYKKLAAEAYDRWCKKLAEFAKLLEPIEEELAKLKKNSKPSEDDKQKIKDLELKRDPICKKIELAPLDYHKDLMKFDVDPKVDKKEALKLPDILEKIIKEKGVPLGAGWSIAPDVDWDFKKMKPKKVLIEFTHKF